MNKKYIVAGTQMEFRVWVANRVKHDVMHIESDFVYVSHVNILRGLPDIEGYFIGTYKQRPDIAEIEQQIHIIKAIKSKNISYSTTTIKPIGNTIIGGTITGISTGSVSYTAPPKLGEVKYDPIMQGLMYWNGNIWETAILNRT
jgi:hypothetical protein